MSGSARTSGASLRGAALTVLAMVIAAGIVGAQSSTFVSRVETVRIDALVTDGGRAVTGLTSGDFEILDNGVAQKADLVTFEQIPLNVVLALDMSGSLDVDDMLELRKAGRVVVDGLRAGDRAGVVTFNGMVTIASHLTNDASRLRLALDAPNRLGNTALIDASYASLVLAESDTARGLVIVFSDGADTGSFLRPGMVLNTARRTDAVVYAVSAPTAGLPVDEFRHFLPDLCDLTGGRILAPSANNLSNTFLTIFNEFRQRYLVSYTPNGVSNTGWHKLEVKLKGRKGAVRARSGYQVGT